MRVISGQARGTRLKRVPGDSTRPIMDRVKESLFNIIGTHYIVDMAWLDLFAGTGAVGIEALSRGAKRVVFIDNTKAAIHTIQDNLAHTKLADRALVRHKDAFQWLETAAPPDIPFDLIYIAPPQYHGIWVGALAGVDLRLDALLKADGMVVVQIDPKEYAPIELENLVLEKERKYGSTLLLFYGRP